MLLEGADTLRGILRTRITEELPYEFVFMSVAHLLEELARSVRAGQDPSEHTVDAALEITRHLRHRNP